MTDPTPATNPPPTPTDRHLTLAHFDDLPEVQTFRLSITTEDLLILWECLDDSVEYLTDYLNSNEDDEADAQLIALETLQKRFASALQVIPPNLRGDTP